MIKFSESDPVVVDFELVDSVDVRYGEVCPEEVRLWVRGLLEGGPDERVDPDELHLNVGAGVRTPDPVLLQLLDADGVNHLVVDGVGACAKDIFPSAIQCGLF